eukprot:TRINITY_DN8064_c0_g1_i3.p2 TRINITY_DN8064_c0_g1~~TRINITY_DN8064_c0_g1_i3.p2  ORF type:complete len:323 (-),score=34.15 TRINITY_DN8064_c0_g1_i3:1576-2544(-)
MLSKQQNQEVVAISFMSVSLAGQRMSSSVLTAPVRQLSRSAANTAQRMLQAGGRVAYRRLADLSHRIAGPVAFKLHHEFLASKGESGNVMKVGGSGLGYPRASHSARVQSLQGGSRKRVALTVPVMSASIQGGRSNRPVAFKVRRISSLPGGSGLGRSKVSPKPILSTPIPSSSRFVKLSPTPTSAPSQGGHTLVGMPLTLKGRKNLPGGINLGIQRSKVTVTVPKKAQGGVGQLLSSKKTRNIERIVSVRQQGGVSLNARPASGLIRNGKIGGMGLGVRQGVKPIIIVPLQGGMTQGHRRSGQGSIVSPVQGGPSQSSRVK